MSGYLALVLHAHLPFVRHAERERFLEENWLFEAITETYIPLLQLLGRWREEGLRPRLCLTLTPTLCAMLRDPLLQGRYRRHLEGLIELAEKEAHRTRWQRPLHELALFYLERFEAARGFYEARGGELVGAFRGWQEEGGLEVLTSAATHALLPLLAGHAPSVRAQVRVACDDYRQCFGRDPRGFWLPECGYFEGVEGVLAEAGLGWFITDTPGVLYARPRPRYAVFAPLFTPSGVAAFGRDRESAKQVWSRHEGYPGDPRYRDFYRDIGFDLDWDYVRPSLPAADQRGFTGIKYYRITGRSPTKETYGRGAAVQAAQGHAAHFLEARQTQVRDLARYMDRPPLLVAPYDAELFGHWWYEGPEFLDAFVRAACGGQRELALITPGDYLQCHPVNQVAIPAPSSWGEAGFCQVWLNEKNHWIYPHLRVAQERMSDLARRFAQPDPLQDRALRQAGRELLLAQASDWPFILHTGTSPDYARRRIKDHLLRFTRLYEQLLQGRLDETWLAQVEAADNLFPRLGYRYWA
jgi:1,4-alpha-glucan branching enzyme